MTLDHDLWRKAAAACAVAAPHREAGEDWPCSGCLLSASANAPSTGVVCPPCPGGGALGAAGRVPGPPPGPPAAPSIQRPDECPDAASHARPQPQSYRRGRRYRCPSCGFWCLLAPRDAGAGERVPTWERRPR